MNISDCFITRGNLRFNKAIEMAAFIEDLYEEDPIKFHYYLCKEMEEIMLWDSGSEKYEVGPLKACLIKALLFYMNKLNLGKRISTHRKEFDFIFILFNKEKEEQFENLKPSTIRIVGNNIRH